VNSGDGLDVTAVVAGHADDIVPGDTAITVQSCRTNARGACIGGGHVKGAGADAALAETATGYSKIKVGYAGQFMVSRVQPDDVRLTGCHTWMGAVRACFIQWQTTVPGW